MLKEIRKNCTRTWGRRRSCQQPAADATCTRREGGGSWTSPRDFHRQPSIAWTSSHAHSCTYLQARRHILAITSSPRSQDQRYQLNIIPELVSLIQSYICYYQLVPGSYVRGAQQCLMFDCSSWSRISLTLVVVQIVKWVSREEKLTFFSFFSFPIMGTDLQYIMKTSSRSYMRNAAMISSSTSSSWSNGSLNCCLQRLVLLSCCFFVLICSWELPSCRVEAQNSFCQALAPSPALTKFVDQLPIPRQIAVNTTEISIAAWKIKQVWRSWCRASSSSSSPAGAN